MLGTVLRVVDTEVVSVLLLDVPVVELLVRLLLLVELRVTVVSVELRVTELLLVKVRLLLLVRLEV